MTKFNIETSVSRRIPPLAWLLKLEDGPKARLLAGSGVEIHSRGATTHVFEGAWDDEFDKLNYREAENFFGTGFVVDEEGILFSTPTHTLDSLYVLSGRDGVAVSNSLAFLYGHADLALAPGTGLASAAASITKGVHQYSRSLAKNGDLELRRIAYCNFRISGGEITEFAKRSPPSFGSYGEYISYLTGCYAAILRNAAEPGRIRQYEPWTTISSGYDSAACAAIAAPMGCRNAITIDAARYGEADSGAEVAEVLGLNCVVRPRGSPETSSQPYDAEFIASGCGGDAVLAGFADCLSGTVLGTGYHGGRLWDLHHQPSDDLKRADTSGSGLTEFRLRVDFIHAPLCFIGITRHDDLLKISKSEEMRGFRVGGSYDRPIPRRILEEAGVPRGSFAQKKLATNFMLISQERKLTPAILARANSMIRERNGRGRLLRESLRGLPRRAFSAGWQASVRISGAKGLSWLGGVLKLASVRGDLIYGNLFPFTYLSDALFIASVEEVATRYSPACRERSGTREK